MHMLSKYTADARQAELRSAARTRARAAAGDRARVRDRLVARWRAHRLDRELADGVAPEARAGLSVRARTLLEPPVRGALARQLRRVVRDAGRGRGSLGAQVRPRSSDVLAAAEELDSIADRLLAPDAVTAAAPRGAEA